MPSLILFLFFVSTILVGDPLCRTLFDLLNYLVRPAHQVITFWGNEFSEKRRRYCKSATVVAFAW